MLTRIVSGDGPCEGDDDDAKDEIGLVDLAGHSFGITSDPLTQFAVIFSALIHDGSSTICMNSALCNMIPQLTCRCISLLPNCAPFPYIAGKQLPMFHNIGRHSLQGTDCFLTCSMPTA